MALASGGGAALAFYLSSRKPSSTDRISKRSGPSILFITEIPYDTTILMNDEALTIEESTTELEFSVKGPAKFEIRIGKETVVEPKSFTFASNMPSVSELSFHTFVRFLNGK